MMFVKLPGRSLSRYKRDYTPN